VLRKCREGFAVCASPLSEAVASDRAGRDPAMPIPHPRRGVQSSVEDVAADGGDDLPAQR